MTPFADTPVLAALVTELAERRRLALADADQLRARLRDLEALHEPDAGGDCPTCAIEAPCPTLLLATGRIDLDAAYAAVRGHIDLTEVEQQERAAPEVPSLAAMLAAPTSAIDRAFDALLGLSSRSGPEHS
jgi:hypothetical protein